MVKSNDETLKAYDAIAPLYEEYSSQKIKYLNAVDELILGNLKSSDRWLDIGSGDGRRLKKINDQIRVNKLVAIEPSSEMEKILKSRLDIPVFKCLAEDIGKLDIGNFTVATAMWNVFGHIANGSMRLKAICEIYNKLEVGGKFIFDVNNRHNAPSYGWRNIILRKLVDTFDFKEQRGDTQFDWKIQNQTFRSKGHLFTPEEIELLIQKSGFKIDTRFTLDYKTGIKYKSKYRGQLFYILTK